MANLTDPIALAVIWTRLQAIVDEAGAVLMRTAFSSIVRESKDFTVLLTNRSGYAYAETKLGVGAFGPAIGATVRSVLEVFPVDTWRPGDVVITNDPWIAAGHTGDLVSVRPVFRRQHCLGFVACAAHLPDVGGRLAPSDAKEVYEEGIIFPPTHLVRGGEPVSEVVRLIEMNVRVPDQVIGDILAQVSCEELCDDRLNGLLDEYRIDDTETLAAAILARTENAMRARIAALPDGTYTDRVTTDGHDRPLVICATITIAGEELALDFAGSAPQVAVGINNTLNFTRGYAHYTLKCLLDPHGPNNDGATRPIRIEAPEGSVLNARYPAPTYARSQTGHYLGSLLPSALARAAPDRVIAGCGSPSNRTVFNGRRADGKPYSFLLFTSGGFGARAVKDGLSCTPFPANTGGAPIETMERETGLLVLERKLSTDSGGDGRFRGGLGQTYRIQNAGAEPVRISIRMDRMSQGAKGLFGGRDGACADLRLNGATGRLSPKGPGELAPGDVLTITTPGGAGYGPPHERSADARRRDLEAGHVTAGVGID